MSVGREFGMLREADDLAGDEPRTHPRDHAATYRFGRVRHPIGEPAVRLGEFVAVADALPQRRAFRAERLGDVAQTSVNDTIALGPSGQQEFGQYSGRQPLEPYRGIELFFR